MSAKFFKIRCITNMHMGDGDINFNIVDNEVQKDSITGFPCMYASGIKGALRDAYPENDKDEKITKNQIFGTTGNEGKGKVKFLQGNLLFQAVRASSGNKAYYLVTCPELINNYLRLRNELLNEKNKMVSHNEETAICSENSIGIDGIEYKCENNEETAICSENSIGIDGIEYKCENNEELLNIIRNLVEDKDKDRIVIIQDSAMKKIELPIIARNKLKENGESDNLWYEEVVPRESIFYFVTISEEQINCNFPNIVQFGGNASIGYGLTKVSEI